MARPNKTYIQKYFEDNFLDGNDIDDCGGAELNMVCAVVGIKILVEAIANSKDIIVYKGE